MSVTFESNRIYYVYKPKGEDQKKFNWKKSSKKIIFLLALVLLHPYISKSTNNFEFFLHIRVDLKE